MAPKCASNPRGSDDSEQPHDANMAHASVDELNSAINTAIADDSDDGLNEPPQSMEGVVDTSTGPADAMEVEEPPPTAGLEQPTSMAVDNTDVGAAPDAPTNTVNPNDPPAIGTC